MKKIISIMIALLTGFCCQAQVITAAEYFFDSDPGLGLATPIAIGSPGTSVSFTTSIPTAPLSPGFHTLAIRTKNDQDTWSLFETRAIYISQALNNAASIVEAEYFIDSDPGTGNGQILSIGSSGDEVNFTAFIPTASLSAGFHVLAIRTRDADGVWGLFETRAFYISGSALSSPSITAAEFFIDHDPGVGNGTAASIGSPGNEISFTLSIPASGLDPGFHVLGIRTRDASGTWSLFETRTFYVSAATVNMPEITAAEYFIDSDPGVGNGTALSISTPGTIINQSFVVNVPPGTTNGDHILAIRTRDASGLWSLFEAREFTVAGTPLPLDWLSFTGERVQDKNVLKWETENESNTLHFEVERSVDGISFHRIGTVASMNTPSLNAYSYEDLQPARGNNFYRLKQVDLTGESEFSKIIRIFFGGDVPEIKTYPNPVKDRLMIAYGGTQQKVYIQVFDAGGKMVLSKQVNAAQQVELDVKTLAAGKYWIHIWDGLLQKSSAFIKPE